VLISYFCGDTTTPYRSSNNAADTLEDCLQACQGYGYANFVRNPLECTCSRDCAGGYGPVVSVSNVAAKRPGTVTAEVYALTPVRTSDVWATWSDENVFLFNQNVVNEAVV
jgi:hypothetical protein